MDKENLARVTGNSLAYLLLSVLVLMLLKSFIVG